MGLLMDTILICIMAYCMYRGYTKGLINVAVSIVAFVISLVISLVLYIPITNLIINNTEIDEKIEEVIVNNFSEESDVIEENNAVNTYLQNYAKNITENTQSAVVETAAEAIAVNIIGICVLIWIFLIARIILVFVSSIAKLVAKLPIINQFNKAGGVLYGFLKGLLIVYVLLAVLFFIVSINGDTQITTAIESSIATEMFYENNIILNLLF